MTARPNPWRAAFFGLLLAVIILAAGWTTWSTHRALTALKADVAAQGQAIKEIANWINARAAEEPAVVASDRKESPK